MTNQFNMPAVLSLMALAVAYSTAPTLADDSVAKTNGIENGLRAQTGVYHRSKTGLMPDFVSDPTWPAPLPHSWLLGQIGGLYVDSHDHIWVYNRPRTLTNDESGLEPAVPGALDGKGQPINGLGFARASGFGANCCKSAPSVLEFDASGKLLRAWGGPSDPGFIGGKCKAEDGCIWPANEHGIYVDTHDNVWLGGNAAALAAGTTMDISPWAAKRDGGDGLVLKFDMDGNFKLRIGGVSKGPDSNNKNGGFNATPLLYRAADMVVDPKTNWLYVADGYGNRRVLIVDADTGKYIGHFGAYGNSPVDDAAVSAQGLWSDAEPKGMNKPAFFRNPVHCVKIADDGKIYVCDRGNNRIQVFDVRNPSLGQPCNNQNGEVGKCGFLTERWISRKTYSYPLMPGTVSSITFSPDKAQSCLYASDSTNQTIYVLNRGNLEELGRFGQPGRMTGRFHWLHQLGVDSRGNVYTSEADTGKRVQKFTRYGATACSGSGAQVVGDP
jgi:DNA-binding beta-propeller fold protein YncE